MIYIGSFIETKGIRVLLEAIKRCPYHIVFHFAGKGRLEDSIRKMADSHKNICLHGFLKEEELNKLLSQMDILVCPSVWAEPFGRVIIDGYKACVPAIVSDIGGMPELVEDGITGLIVTPGSPDDLAQAIIAESKKKMTVKRIDAIWNKLQHFSITKQGDKFMEIYKKFGGYFTIANQYPFSQNLRYNAGFVRRPDIGQEMKAA